MIHNMSKINKSQQVLLENVNNLRPTETLLNNIALFMLRNVEGSTWL